MEASEWLALHDQCSDDVRAASAELREREQFGPPSAKDRRVLSRKGVYGTMTTKKPQKFADRTQLVRSKRAFSGWRVR